MVASWIAIMLRRLCSGDGALASTMNEQSPA